MARDRLLLQSDLTEILGSEFVYFQPPANISMQYPCIVYTWDDVKALKANNGKYKTDRRYQLIHISQKSEDPVVAALEALPYTKFRRRYTEGNLHHTVFDIYF